MPGASRQEFVPRHIDELDLDWVRSNVAGHGATASGHVGQFWQERDTDLLGRSR